MSEKTPNVDLEASGRWVAREEFRCGISDWEDAVGRGETRQDAIDDMRGYETRACTMIGSQVAGRRNDEVVFEPGSPTPDPAFYIVNGSSGTRNSRWWGHSIPGWPGDGCYFIGDFNGDGTDDIAFLKGDGRWYVINGANGNAIASRWGHSIEGWPGDGRYFIGDFNGDGTDDIAFLKGDGRWYIINGADGSESPSPWWGHSIEGWPGDGRYFIGDFNGDGTDDIAFLKGDGRWYIINGANGNAIASRWGHSIEGWPGDGRYFIGDFNGDGTDDIAFLKGDGRWYIINGADGSEFPSPWWGHSIEGWPGDGRYFIGDFNGDGTDDIAFLKGDGRWYIINGADGSASPSPWFGYAIPGWPGDGRYFIGDFNGNNVSDVAFLRP